MKKINVLLIIALSVIVFSCGKKEENKDAAKAAPEKEVIKDCGCNELTLIDEDSGIDTHEYGNFFGNFKNITKKGSKELFTGTCTEKDQNDSIIKKVDVKNGWLVKEVLKEKIGKIYVTTMDLNFENEKPSNGWVRYFTYDEESQREKYFKKCIEYKNGKIFNEWSVLCDTRDNLLIGVNINVKDGKEAQPYDDIMQPKCMPDSEFNVNWSLYDISPERYNEIINCLKGELPHFDYWKM